MSSDGDRRLESLAQTLALDPSDWGAFAGVVALLTAREDWKQLSRAYRRMAQELTMGVGAVDGRPREEVSLEVWLAMARLYRDRLDDPTSALTAFELVTKQHPDDEAGRFELASLYEEGGQLDSAIDAYEATARVAPWRHETYRRLFDLHMHRRELDAAWCAAASLVFFRRLDGPDRDFFEDYRPRRLGARRGRLDAAAWKLLCRSGEDERLSRIFRVVAPAPPPAAPSEVPVFGPLVAWAADLLGVEGETGAGLSPDESLDAVHGERTLRELLFLAGREAAYRREPRLSALARGRTVRELMILLLGARKVVSPAHVPPEPFVADVAAAAAGLERALGPDSRHELKAVLDGVGKVDVKAWRDAVLLTGVRAGLLLVGDPGVVKKMLDAEQLPGGEPSVPLQMNDVFAFGVSKEYLALRARLGRGVGMGADEPA